MPKRTLSLLLGLAALTACGEKEAPIEAPAESVETPSPYAAVEADVVAAMNTEADPCVDFYEYTCGGWMETNEIPADRARWGRSFASIYEQNLEILHTLLDEAVAADSDDPVQAKLGAYYGACMDTEAIDAAGIAPVQPMLDEVDALSSKEDLIKHSGKLSLQGIGAFFGQGVWPDFEQVDLNILHVAQGGLGLPDREYYLAEDEASQARLTQYTEHVSKMLTLSGVPAEEAATQAQAVVAFETELARVSWERADLRNTEKIYNKVDLPGLEELTPNLSMASYFEGMGYPAIQHINVETPSYFEGMDAAIAGAELSTLKAYLRWHIISDASAFLGSELDQENFAFYGQVLSGQETQRERWKRCVSRTESAMGEVMGQAYVDQKFAGDSKDIAVEMITNVELAMKASFPELSWMDDPTRAVAGEKVDTITNKIGYPDKWRDFSGLTIEGDAHWQHELAAREFESRFWLDMVGNPVDTTLWYMTPQTVNAYYNPLANEIVFPAGIMQPPFFSKDFPKAMNYGAMGMVMGHEVTHGFDDEGRKFGPSGKMEEWWAPEVAENFEEVASCIVDQYNGYEALPADAESGREAMNVNGELTLGENIADVGGLKQSYEAYLLWKQANGDEPMIGGLTNEQLFFVAYGQSWCSKIRDEALESRLKTDPHSPAYFRINGAVQNSPAFHEAFSCEAGTPMHPEDICEVW